MSPARWCPTPEQLMILEEMYRSGVRTPNATQIQHITTHLSFYGKIEGKNVFYWFQNHKARERQKLRRKLGKQLQFQRQHQHQLLHFPLLHNHHFSNTTTPQHFFHYFASPFSPHHPLQGGDEISNNNNNKSMKKESENQDDHLNEEKDKPLMESNGRDWMMMMVDLVGATPPQQPTPAPCCGRPPLKTLELFPITSTNLKEECNPSS